MSNGDTVDSKAILKQLEFYFSDANLSHDGFFRTEVQRSPDASLGLDLLLRCNRLKALGATKHHLLAAVKHSKLLETNATGTAIRRLTPPIFAPISSECIVLATGIPRLQSEADGEEAEEEEVAADQDIEELEAEEEIEAVEEGELEQSKSPMENDQLEEDTRPDMGALDCGRAIDWLREQLHVYGKVNYINMPRFKTSGALRGFAFVEFASRSAAKRAVSALAPTERDLVCPLPVPDVNSSTKKVAAVSHSADAGWTPKSAPYATTLSIDERLARQFVWRCCSRRSKQVLAAYRRLFAAGYRLPNPLDAEYRLITEGVSISEKEGENAEGGAGTTGVTGLRLHPYRDWLIWRPRFYTWLRAWTERMRKKTNQLIVRAERKRHLPIPPALHVRHVDASVPITEDSNNIVAPGKTATEEMSPTKEAAKLPLVALPDNFCPGTVVEVYWPLDEELMSLEPRQQMRRVRAAIEHNVLQPHRLLRSVAHFDAQACVHLPPLKEVGVEMDTCTNPSTSQPLDTTARARVFVRFHGCTEAQTFARLLCEFPLETDYNGDSTSEWAAWGCVLEGQRERAYCMAIAAAKAGGAERRRRIQAAKRRRRADRPQLQATERPQLQKPNAGAVVDNGLPKPTRIVFDEE